MSISYPLYATSRCAHAKRPTCSRGRCSLILQRKVIHGRTDRVSSNRFHHRFLDLPFGHGTPVSDEKTTRQRRVRCVRVAVPAICNHHGKTTEPSKIPNDRTTFTAALQRSARIDTDGKELQRTAVAINS